MNLPSLTVAAPIIALAGNPNSGKTTLFNALTGLRQKVANYPGVTVERKEGRLVLPGGAVARTLDLPGAYSLTAASLDEHLAVDTLLGRIPGLPAPDLVVVVVDASNLERNLYLAGQVLDCRLRTVIALNMIDVARARGVTIDAARLARALGVPVVPIIARKGEGLDTLRRAMVQALAEEPPEPMALAFEPPVEHALAALSTARDGKAVCKETAADGNSLPPPGGRVGGNAPPIDTPLPHPPPQGGRESHNGGSRDASSAARGEALRLLCGEDGPARARRRGGPALAEAVETQRAALLEAGLPWWVIEAEARYRVLKRIVADAARATEPPGRDVSVAVDRVLTHRVLGPLSFLAVMALLFQALFTFAQYPMDWIDAGFAELALLARATLPAGPLAGLVADGIIVGVGAVVIFLPQIVILFFFLAVLEDVGYMARAAFLMDRLMKGVGLHGKSFIPLLSSFACAVPGIMATRTIENRKDRLATIAVAPLMTCSARLPVYVLLIAVFIPAERAFTWSLGSWAVVGPHWQGLTMLSLYLLGIGTAMAAAFLLKRSLLKGATPPLLLELPPYRLPNLRNIASLVGTRAGAFLKKAGTIILACAVVLWVLAEYPHSDAVEADFARRRAALRAEVGAEAEAPDGAATSARARLDALAREETGAQRAQSVLGRLGRLIEPALAPLGYDWRLGVGIVASLAAREVFVGSTAIIFNAGEGEDAERRLQDLLRTDPATGGPRYPLRTGLSLMVFYAFALMCLSTLVVARRETGGWAWPAFMMGALSLLAYGAAWAVYQLGAAAGV